MKIISDIRLFKAVEDQRLSDLQNKGSAAACHRIAMKLRENGFSLGDFDHLYVVLSTLSPKGSIVLEESIDRYHPWYRYVYVGAGREEVSAIETNEDSEYIFGLIEKVLFDLFCNSTDDRNIVRAAITEAKKGPAMLMRFKEKKAGSATATVYLRLMNNMRYLPLLCVTDMNGREVLRKDLPETIDLGIIGDIQLSGRKVTVKPRKNPFTKDSKPISFELECG